MEKAGSFVRLIFSWSLDDILNNDLCRDKVKNIPRTFLSVQNYLKAFNFPLIEETRTDLCSGLKMLSQAPVCEVTDVVRSKDYNPPHDLFYWIEMKITGDIDKTRDFYEPEVGDLIALTDTKPPSSLDDLKNPENSFFVALIKRVKTKKQNEDFYKVHILVSKPVELEMYLQKDDMYIHGFAVYLTNITTNMHIWNALNSDPEGPGVHIIKQLLQSNSAVGENCGECFSHERHAFDVSRTGAAIRKFDLNKAQEEGVLSCIAARECSHKNSVKLIWGPPGTGKTKTVGSLLFALLKRKCRTLTCAPTNVAVLEVTSRFLRLVMESLDFHTYGLGDIILFGNRKRMIIDNRDDLLDIFLDYRANSLAKCFAPKSGWKHNLQWLICLLENPEKQYDEYLLGEKKMDYEKDNVHCLKEENEILAIVSQGTNQEKKNINLQDLKICKQNEWTRIINATLRESRLCFKGGNKSTYDKQEKDFLFHDNKIKKLTFHEFVKNELNSILWQMRRFAIDMCTHLPTSCISLRVVKSIFECLDLLKVLAVVLSNISITHQGLKDALSTSFVDESSVSCCTWQAKFLTTRKECLNKLKSIQNAMLTLPEFSDEYKIKKFCFAGCRMIFCTAASSAKLYQLGLDRVEMLVIDEAAQLKECESNIPLQLPSLRHAVLIGDEKQLPALVKSEISNKAGFGRSLFERLVLLGHKKHLLNVQYRMHPSISLFPNIEFYDKQILDSSSVKERSYEKHFLHGDMFKAYSFIDVAYGQNEFDEGNSRRNMVEVAVVSEIVLELYKESTSRKQNVSVGVITPYKAQVLAIQDALGKRFGGDDHDFTVKVSTVDGFQGGEEDVIIVSTVRYDIMGYVGFISNFQRTNVALTRARYCLWIVGSGVTLMNSASVWERLVLDAKARGCYHSAEKDERLCCVIAAAMLGLGQVRDSLNLNSLLFRKARWRVCFTPSFLTSMTTINNTEVCKKICSMLMQLSIGWRQPHHETNVGITDDTSSQLVELYKVNELLYLVWTTDILEENSNYIQVLKIWDVLPLSKVPKVARDIDISFRNYSVDILRLCQNRCYDGKFAVPKTSLASSNYPTGYSLLQADSMEFLCNKFASLRLWDV